MRLRAPQTNSKYRIANEYTANEDKFNINSKFRLGEFKSSFEALISNRYPNNKLPFNPFPRKSRIYTTD